LTSGHAVETVIHAIPELSQLKVFEPRVQKLTFLLSWGSRHRTHTHTRLTALCLGLPG